MNNDVGAASRTGLGLLGLALLVAGGLGLATAFGAFGAERADEPVLPMAVRAYPAQHPWFWWAVAGGCVLVALLALRWLASQLPIERITRIDRTENGREGYTTVHSGALTEAVEYDAQQIPGVSGASAHVATHPSRLSLRVDLAAYADIPAVRHQLQSRTVAHVRQALDQDDFPVEIELRPERTTGRNIT